MEELEKAIKRYCEMLPYPNRGGQPLDDRRLYEISRIASENNLRVEPQMLIPYLQENPNTNLEEDQLLEFSQNRCDEINHGAYIIDRAFGD